MSDLCRLLLSWIDLSRVLLSQHQMMFWISVWLCACTSVCIITKFNTFSSHKQFVKNAPSNQYTNITKSNISIHLLAHKLQCVYPKQSEIKSFSPHSHRLSLKCKRNWMNHMHFSHKIETFFSSLSWPFLIEFGSSIWFRYVVC